MQSHIKAGYRIAVDLDLAKFFDNVQHDILMARVATRVGDKRLLALIGKYLRAGVLVDEQVQPSEIGTPQGGPLSPLLANILLDALDRELKRRGHRFVRSADDGVPRTHDLRFGKCDAAREMRAGPSKPACRSRLQTTLSCMGQESVW